MQFFQPPAAEEIRNPFPASRMGRRAGSCAVYLTFAKSAPGEGHFKRVARRELRIRKKRRRLLGEDSLSEKQEGADTTIPLPPH